MNTIIAIIILLTYTIIMCIRGGKIPSSLSASVFDLPQNMHWIWTITIYSVCFLTIPTIISKASENTQFLAFIAIAALAFVGAAPLVKDKQDIAYKVHCVAAVICAVCSQIMLAFNCPWLLLCWVPWIIAWFELCSTWRTMTFWAEAVCFASTFAYCMI